MIKELNFSTNSNFQIAISVNSDGISNLNYLIKKKYHRFTTFKKNNVKSEFVAKTII